jgi:hypothetical protein
MTLALIILAGFVIGEGLIIFALINRILAQARVPPLEVKMPWRDDAKDETPQAERRKLFSVDIPS